MLRGRLACFAAPWESGSHTRHDGGESEDEYESLAGAGVREPSLSSLAAANSGGCVRWTLRGSALRKKPEQALDCMVRELDQHEAAATPPPLAVSTEAVAWLLSSRANDQGEEGPILKRILAYCGRVETVRVVERDQRRSHVCDLSLFPALTTLELVGVAPSFLARDGLAVAKARLRSLTFQRAALCHLDELLLLPPQDQPWDALERLILRDCETLDLAPASALTHRHLCPKLQELAAPRNRLRSLAALARSDSDSGSGGSSDLNGAAVVPLRALELSRNAITSVACLNRHPTLLLQRLQSLSLAHNAMRSTAGLEALPALRRLDLAHNLLESFADVERLGQLSDLEALALEGNPLALAPGSKREYRLRVFAVLRSPPRAGGGDWGEEPKQPLLLDGRGMDVAEAEELTRRMGPVYDAPLVVAKPAATPPMTERLGDDGAASASNGSSTPPGTTNDGSAPATAMPPPPPPLPPRPAITIPPPPASPSSVSSAGSASLARGVSSLASVASSGGGGNGRRSRSGTPTTPGGSSSKTRTVKGADGRARRVAMIEEEGQQPPPQRRPGSSGVVEEAESLEVALDRCLAERHSAPTVSRTSSSSSTRAKKKGAKDKGSSSGGSGGGKKRRSASAASASPLGEMEGRLSQMREELQALEARLAAARAEVAVVEGAKGVAAGGGSDDAVVVGQQERGEVEVEVEAGVDAQPQSEPDQQGAENGGADEQAPQPVVEEEEEAELVQLNLRASELGVGEETLEGEQEAQAQQPTAVPSDDASTPEEAKAPPPTGEDAGGTDAPAPTTAATTVTTTTATATAAPSTSGNNLRRFLSLSDLDSLRAFLLDHQVFGSVTGATSSLLQAFEIDPARSVFHSLALPRPETLLHLHKERVLADARRKSGHVRDLLPVETTVLLAVTDQHLYVIDPAFAAPNPSGHMKHFSEAPPPLLLARHPLRALDRVVLGFKGQWGRLEFNATDDAATTPVPAAARRSSVVGRRQGPSPSPTLSAFGDEEGDAGVGNDEEEGGVSCRLLREEGSVPGDPVVVVGYTLVTRSKAQTFRILNAELRPLANEARLGRGGAGTMPGRLSGSGAAGLMRERALSGGGSSGRSSLGKVAIVNAEEAALEALEGVGGLRYYEMVYQWSRKHSQLLPRTVMVTEGGELIVAVEDLRQDPTLPLPLAAANAGGLLRAGSGGFVDAELERGGSGASDSLLVEGGGGRSSADKFSPVPAAGERMTVLLRAPLADVVEAVEEARDPRYVTLVVREPSAFGLLKRSHTWRLFSEDRRPVDALLRLLRDSVAA